MNHTDSIIKLTPDMIYTGNLVLVNHEYPLRDQSQTQHFVSVTTIQQASSEEEHIRIEQTCLQQLNSLLEACQGKEQIGIVSGYRTVAEQQYIYDRSLLENGAEFTANYVALPNESEHQTGLAVDVGELTTNVNYLCPSFPDHGVCASFKQLAATYGFIQRYKEGKEHLTNIACEPWHYRYVGVPHSILMEQYDMCMEEYIQYVKQFTFEGSHLFKKYKDHLIEMYYVEVGEEEKAITIKPHIKYECSGNNVDGVIMAIFHQQGQAL